MGCNVTLIRGNERGSSNIYCTFLWIIISSNGATKFYMHTTHVERERKKEVKWSEKVEKVKYIKLLFSSYLFSLSLSNEGYKFIKCDLWKMSSWNQFYLKSLHSSVRVVSNWEEFFYGEKKTFIMSNKTFSFMHKFRQQFFNSFPAHI